MTVIPHGVDPALFRPPEAQQALQYYTRERPFRLLYVSTIDFYKHQSTVVRAVGLLRREGLPLAMRFVGAAYPRAARQLRVAFATNDPGGEFLRYDGPVGRGDLADVYAATDAFVFASTCENLPNILLEAMASGLPIASSDRRPMPDVLGPDAAYFDPESLESTAGAIRALVGDDGARQRFARTAYARAQTFSWERCADQTLSFIRHTASMPTSAAAPISEGHA
jgi:glycosyltransferase involved in cell wall biosynthesis